MSKKHPYTSFLVLVAAILLTACGEQTPSDEIPSSTDSVAVDTSVGFVKLSSEETGIDFVNQIVKEYPNMNCFNFFNIYNGGGVAVGDVNNDGLQDIYFTGNQVPNQLFINKGDMKFEDVTNAAGVGGSPHWTTGVTMADVNGDGWLDIYVCMSGGWIHTGAHRANLLYINNGDLTFTEQAHDYGVADTAQSTDANFFDYDRDGDLDLYVVNHPVNFNAGIQDRLESSKNPDDSETDKFFRNNGDGTYTNVTDEAGVRNWAFGLSSSTGDFNNDGWIDIFVANDYTESDRLYINQKDGTFKDEILTMMSHITFSSMGSDAADFNNDGFTDLIVVDMMAEDNRRKKINMSGMVPEAFQMNVDYGRHHQYMQNVLQLNNGNNTFSDVAEMTGMAFTDWSWSSLFCDLDNDGFKDVYITNGQRRDIRNNDFVRSIAQYDFNYIFDNHEKLAAKIPVEKVPNYVYRNTGRLSFEKKAGDWGLNHSGFTHGAAYTDLDNDGDLDLVVNNLEEASMVYENKMEGSNYLRVKLKGDGLNTHGIGAKAIIEVAGEQQVVELSSTRGYLSSSEPILHFGLGDKSKVDVLTIKWADGRVSKLSSVEANQVLTVKQSEAADEGAEQPSGDLLVEEIQFKDNAPFVHKDKSYDDFERETLLPHKYSQLGPFTTVADVDANGLQDFYVGGGAGQSGMLYKQTTEGVFAPVSSPAFAADKRHEDMCGEFFDADGDGDLDLYVASGGNQWDGAADEYQDRLYLNNGSGKFSRSAANVIPQSKHSTSCVKAADFDQDGDMDLFVGGRLSPGAYPMAGKSTILVNDKGVFKDETNSVTAGLSDLGMVTSAEWVDIDGDQDLDLMVVGEWLAPTLYLNSGGVLSNASVGSGLEDYQGWWYSLEAADIDNDGDMDFVAGNLGLNSKYHGSKAEPFRVFGGDIDGDGSNDIVLAYYSDGVSYPVRGRECSSQQIPELKKDFPTYEEFSGASVEQVYAKGIGTATRLEAKHFETSYFENLGDGRFEVHVLPADAQRSTVNGIVVVDINADGDKDVILAGNLYETEVETSRHDGAVGSVLLGDGSGGFSPVPLKASGFDAGGDVKDVELIRGTNGIYIAVTRNSEKMSLFRLGTSQD